MSGLVKNNDKLPEGWERTTLGEIIKPSTEKINPPNINEMPYVGLEHIEKHTGKLLDYGSSKNVRSTKTRFSKGDLLYGKLRPYLNKVYVADFDGICSTDILVFSKSSFASNKYLLYRFLSGDFVRFANQNVSGVQHPRVDFKKLSNFPISLPPLNAQNLIVSEIEKQFSRLDEAVAALKRVRASLKRYKASVLKAAVEGKLTEEKIKWNETTFGEIISISSGDGLTKTQRNDEGEYLVYGGNGIAGRHSEFMYEEEKLIIGRVGVHCGNAHITKPKSWITDNAFVVSFDKKSIDIKFLFYLICFLNLNKYSSSTAQPVISQGKLYPIEISIPEKKEDQQKIVEEIESRLSVAEEIEETIDINLKRAESLRQAILKKAFLGRLVNYEQ